MEIQKYNEKLISSSAEINILDYVKKLNENFYNIDIQFSMIFLNL